MKTGGNAAAASSRLLCEPRPHITDELLKEFHRDFSLSEIMSTIWSHAHEGGLRNAANYSATVLPFTIVHYDGCVPDAVNATAK